MFTQLRGTSKKALEYYGKALAIKEKVLGAEHPSTARTYGNLSGVYLAQLDLEKALEYSLKALTVSEKMLGLKHPYTAKAYGNVSGVYLAQGDFEKALEYSLKALAVTEKMGFRKKWLKNTKIGFCNKSLISSLRWRCVGD